MAKKPNINPENIGAGLGEPGGAPGAGPSAKRPTRRATSLPAQTGNAPCRSPAQSRRRRRLGSGRFPRRSAKPGQDRSRPPKILVPPEDLAVSMTNDTPFERTATKPLRVVDEPRANGTGTHTASEFNAGEEFARFLQHATKLERDGEPLGTLRAWLDLAEAWRITQALRACKGNRSAAARMLGIGRRTLYSKMEKLDITPTWTI